MHFYVKLYTQIASFFILNNNRVNWKVTGAYTVVLKIMKEIMIVKAQCL